MDVRDGFIGSIGNTPLIRLEGPSKATGCNILGKAEFLNPGGSVKDRAAHRDRPRRRAARPAEARRRDRRGHGRQYRHRPGAGRQRAGLPHRHRHAGDAEPGEEGHAAPDRRGSPAGAGRALRQSRTTTCRYSETLAEELAETEPNGAIWANQFDNVANREGHCGDHRPGDLAADRRHGRRLHLRRRHRRDAGGRRDRAEGKEPGHPDRAGRSDGLRACTTIMPTAS